MARLYEMCNEIDSDDILMDREELTEEEKERLLAGLREQKVIGKKHGAWRYAAGIAAAAVLAVIVLPNVSPRAAYAMSQIPVLGNVIKVITVREYDYESERFEAKITEAQLVQEEAEADRQENLQDDAVREKTNESIEQINLDIGTMTERLIQKFEEDVAAGESYGGVYVNPEVVTDTDKWFTIRIDVAEVAGSGTQYQYYYHIDKTTGAIATLKDLFKDGADYVTPISENIIKQMRERMAEDENLIYWVDDEEIPEWNFRSIKEDQNFYLNENGQIVICFDEYEVAPGYMGLVEFTIEDEAVADILK